MHAAREGTRERIRGDARPEPATARGQSPHARLVCAPHARLPTQKASAQTCRRSCLPSGNDHGPRAMTIELAIARALAHLPVGQAPLGASSQPYVHSPPARCLAQTSARSHQLTLGGCRLRFVLEK
jgi:hypothetical protein